MIEVQNDNFVVKLSIGLEDRVAIGNLKSYGEGIYIEESQIDDLILALQEFKKNNR